MYLIRGEKPLPHYDSGHDRWERFSTAIESWNKASADMVASEASSVAVWVITPNGVQLAESMGRVMTDADIYVSNSIDKPLFVHFSFQRLKDELGKSFDKYSGHVFIMSTGIVVRLIAPLMKHKTCDPAVVVVDDGGQHAISLLSGHLGGANELARKIAVIIGARAVITTATDVNQLPAIDILAKENNLTVENPAAIKTVNMAILKGEKIYLHDPFKTLPDGLPKAVRLNFTNLKEHAGKEEQVPDIISHAGVYIDDAQLDLPASTLVLRPASLAAGIGCNRNTETGEITSLLKKTLGSARLSLSSLACLASIDVKADEDGLIALSRELELPLVFFERHELNRVMNIENPSTVVEKHVGVKSVCEAAAILAARNGDLIVPKQKTRNVTVAIARIDYS